MASFSGVSVRAAVVPLPDLGPTEMVGSMTMEDAALVSMRPSIGRFLALEPAVRLGDDPEAIHDMRVAVRRIRTSIRVFRGGLPEWAREVRGELRWVGSLLGEVRDVDVRRESIASAVEDLPAEERGVVHALDELLLVKRVSGHARLVEALDATRFERIRHDVVALARGLGQERAEGPEAARPIATVAPSLVRRPYRAMRRSGKRLGSEAPSAALHKLRLRCKRARYALEFVSPLYGEPAGEMIDRFVRLQDLLGGLHDSEAAVETWRELAASDAETLPTDAAFVLGRLAERSAENARTLRRRFPRTFRRVQGRRWKELKRVMEANASV